MRWEVIMMTGTKAFYDFVLFEKITGLNKFLDFKSKWILKF